MASRRKMCHVGKKRTCKRGESADRESKMMKFMPETLHSELYQDLGVEVLRHTPSDDEDEATANSKIPCSTQSPATNQMSLYDITNTPSPVRSFPVHNHTRQLCSCQQVKEVGPTDDRFQTLTDEVILSVFKWLPISSLPSCARVCKRWKAVAYDDSLWRRVNLTGYQFQPGTLEQVLERGCNAVKLAQASIMGPLGLGSQPQTYSLRRGTCKQRNSQPKLAIEYLDLSNCKIDDDQLLHNLLSRCHKLRKLSLECCRVDTAIISAIATLSGDTLEDLNLCMCSGVTQEAIHQILVCCKRLKSLNLAWCVMDSLNCLNPLFTITSTTLKYLNLSGYRLWVNDLRVKHLVENFPNLVDLDLSDSSLSTDSVHEIANNLKNLLHVSLSRCYGVEQYSLVKFGTMAHLEAIDVFGIVSQEALKHLKTLMPRLRINQCPFSAIARPTTRTARKNSIWSVKCWD